MLFRSLDRLFPVAVEIAPAAGRATARAQPRLLQGIALSLCSGALIGQQRNDFGQETQPARRSEEHTSELQSLMRISYAVLCLKKKTTEAHKYTTATQTLIYISHYTTYELLYKP